MKGNIETGRRFGRWTAFLSLGGRGAKYICICDCGETKSVSAYDMIKGTSISCGCFREENRPNLRRTHGMGRSRESKALSEAKQRCHNPKSEKYKWYGARGISVCQEWKDDFTAFFEHIGKCPKGYELDRIDNNKGYEPGNVHWVSKSQNIMNRRNTVMVEYNGEVMTLKRYCDAHGIRYATAWAQLHYRPHLIDCSLESTRRIETKTV
jgi:hypothetical protein